MSTTTPNVTGRTARCSYYGKPAGGRLREGPCNTYDRAAPCLCERPSDPENLVLAFFRRQPDKPHDEFYCGCWGWD